jgi:hypothetical protein
VRRRRRGVGGRAACAIGATRPGRGLGFLGSIRRWRALVSARWRRCSARSARPETNRSASGPCAAIGWMIPRSTPATRSRSRGWSSMPRRAVTSTDEATRVLEQGHRPDGLERVGQVARQTQPTRRRPRGQRDPHPSPLDLEGPVMPAQRHQRPLPARVTGRLTGPRATRRLETRRRVATRHRAHRAHRQLAHPHPGDLAAPRLLPKDRPRPATEPDPVHLDQRRPDVCARTQQAEQPTTLRRRDSQLDPSRPQHHTTPTPPSDNHPSKPCPTRH